MTASDWARGPCLACRSLCNLELLDFTLYPVIDVPGIIHLEVRSFRIFPALSSFSNCMCLYKLDRLADEWHAVRAEVSGNERRALL